MHQEPADDFFAGDCDLFPLSLGIVIFSRKGNRAVRHAFNTVVADCDPMGIFPEIFDNGLRTIKRFLAVRNPFFAVTGVQQFFERIVVFKELRAAVEFKFFIFPKVFQLRKILATEKARNDPDRKEELFSVVFPMVFGVKTAAKDNGRNIALGTVVEFTTGESIVYGYDSEGSCVASQKPGHVSVTLVCKVTGSEPATGLMVDRNVLSMGMGLDVSCGMTMVPAILVDIAPVAGE